MTFQDLHLLPALLRAVSDVGYKEPSPIQQKAIGPVLSGRDLIGCAQTGTGKTAAFAIPILQNLQPRVTKSHKPIRALVLTPTRELALQIEENFTQYGKYLPIRSAVIFGGVGQAPQVEALQKGVDVLIATPGRLNDLCDQGHIDLSHIETFVLDEADRMLDMGFIHDVRKVIKRLPEKRQTLLFSATMPQQIAELSSEILHDPVRVEVTPPSSTVDAIEQSLYKVDKANKRRLLVWLLQKRSEQSVLVFTATKHGADRVVRELTQNGITAMAIHGNKSQTARVNALTSFKEGRIRVLVATDIAARGIDISELPLVINYDLPNVPETYVHRIGRTGRAGRSGLAVSFCNFDELAYLKDIEKLIKKTIPEVSSHPWPMEIFEPAVKQPRPPRPAKQQPSQKVAKPSQQQSKKQPQKPLAPKLPEKKPIELHAEKTPEKKPLVQKSKPTHSHVAPQKKIAPSIEQVKAELHAMPLDAPAPKPQAAVPVKKYHSDPFSRPGKVVAFADGRRSRRRKTPNGK